MNEAQAYMALPSFLKGFAHEQFVAIKDASTEAEGGVTCWPEAVQYLLRLYATPNAIRGATLALRDLRQDPDETERDFSTRLNKAFFRRGNVYPLDEKITLYIDGLNPAIRPIVSRFREDEPRKKVTYQRVVQFAQAEGDALRAGRRVGLPKASLMVNPLTKSDHKDNGKTRVLLADSSTESHDRHSYRSAATQDVDNVYLLQEVTTSIATTDLPSTTYESSTTDPVLVMGRVRPPRVPYQDASHLANTRPGWEVPARRGSPGPAPRKDPVICHHCYLPGHISPECSLPIKDLFHVVKNYEALTDQERQRVPAISYLHAKMRFVALPTQNGPRMTSAPHRAAEGPRPIVGPQPAPTSQVPKT